MSRNSKVAAGRCRRKSRIRSCPRHRAAATCHLPQRCQPIAGRVQGSGDLLVEPLGERAKEPLLAAHVMIKRHRLDAEGGAELAHAEPVQPGSIDQIKRGIDNALKREG